MIKDVFFQQISLQQLCCICVYFNVAGYKKKTKAISITQIKNWLKTFDMMGYNRRSSKNRSSIWKKELTLLVLNCQQGSLLTYYQSNFLPPPEEDNVNDRSSTDSELFPSQLSVFSSPVPANILLDDESEKSQIINKKCGRPPKYMKKEMLQLLPNMVRRKAHTYYWVINVLFDEKHRQDVLDLVNTPTISEVDRKKFPHKAVVWDKILDTYMDIDNDTVGSMAFKHNQFEYHGIDDNYPLNLEMLDSNNCQRLWNF